jgi:hypothetical protein
MAIGVPDKLKGQSIVAYIILKKEYQSSNRNSEAESKIRGEIIQSVVNGIGNFARPEQITFVDDLPRTVTEKQSDEKLEEKASTSNISITRCLNVETLMLGVLSTIMIFASLITARLAWYDSQRKSVIILFFREPWTCTIFTVTFHTSYIWKR